MTQINLNYFLFLCKKDAKIYKNILNFLFQSFIILKFYFKFSRNKEQISFKNTISIFFLNLNLFSYIENYFFLIINNFIIIQFILRFLKLKFSIF
jgi:hypothetical protein